jgi:hypothetical protein
MAPGFFQKVGDFFRKVGKGVKKAVQKVGEFGSKVYEKVKPFVAPALKMIGTKYGIPSEAIDTGLSVGEGILNKVGNYTPQEQQQEEEYDEEEPQQSTPRIRDPGPAYYLRKDIKRR